MVVKEGYKQTEVGVIPKDWEKEVLLDVVEVISGGTPKTSEPSYWGGTIPWLTVADFSTGFRWARGAEKTITEKGLNESPTQMLLHGDIIISARGTVGVVAQIARPMAFNQSCYGLRAKPEIAHKDYVYYSLIQSLQSFQRLAYGGVFSTITRDSFKNIIIKLPPLPEQKAIATALSDMDGLINSLSKLIEKKKNIKQGAMQELLTGKKRLEGFSGDWVEKQLGELFAISAGGDLDKDNYSRFKSDIYKYPVYANAITHKGLYGYMSSSKYPSNSITVTARGLLGYAAYRDQPFDAIGRLLVLVPKETISCFFIAEYINNQIVFAIESTGVPQLTAPQIAKYVLSIPPTIEEQIAIATILSDMDKEIEKLQAKLDKFKAIKQGMMQELLTGRIRLLEGA